MCTHTEVTAVARWAGGGFGGPGESHVPWGLEVTLLPKGLSCQARRELPTWNKSTSKETSHWIKAHHLRSEPLPLHVKVDLVTGYCLPSSRHLTTQVTWLFIFLKGQMLGQSLAYRRQRCHKHAWVSFRRSCSRRETLNMYRKSESWLKKCPYTSPLPSLKKESERNPSLFCQKKEVASPLGMLDTRQNRTSKPGLY